MDRTISAHLLLADPVGCGSHPAHRVMLVGVYRADAQGQVNETVTWGGRGMRCEPGAGGGSGDVSTIECGSSGWSMKSNPPRATA